MAQYLIVYLGGNQTASPEEGKQHFAKHMDWLSSPGDAAISPANPLKDTRTMNAEGAVTNGRSIAMSGYAIIEADSLYTALSIAKRCPFLELGGSLEISELMKMPGLTQGSAD